MYKKLSIDNTLDNGWSTLKKYFGQSIFAAFIAIIGFIISGLFIATFANTAPFIGLIFAIIFGYITTVFYLQAQLDIVMHRGISSKTLINPLKKTHYFLLAILLLLIALSPLLISPPILIAIQQSMQQSIPTLYLIGGLLLGVYTIAIVFLVTFQLSQTIFLILEKNLNTFQAIKESCKMMKGNKMKYFLTLVCITAISYLTLIPFLLISIIPIQGFTFFMSIGYLIYIPVYYLLTTQTFKEMLGE